MAARSMSLSETVGRRVSAVRVTAVQMGIIAGVLAVAGGAFFEIGPPAAYGVCMACHGRDLVNWLLNAGLGTRLTVAQASAIFPLLTTVGVLAGALIGARSSGEFRWRTPEHPLKTFVYGVLVMNFALLAAGCSIRLLLRVAAGEPLGLAGFGAMVIGVVLATWWLQWRARQ